jgi:RHS repeat-associated protein
VPNNNPSGVGAFDFPLRFPGQYFDRETNLAYNVMRDYDPGIGRYLEPDPLGIFAPNSTVVGLNPLYAYVASDPLNQFDFYGLSTGCVAGAGCYSNQLPPIDKVPAPLPKDPRYPAPKDKPDPDWCAQKQAILANCQQCCGRIAQLFRDAAYVSPCNVSCNDKFVCKGSGGRGA